LPTLSADEAAGWMITAARTRPVRIAPRLAVLTKALDAVSPEFVNFFMNRTEDQAEADHPTARVAPTERLARAVRRAVLPAFLHAR
jgi:uncharacterized protein (DUF1800 family)